MHLFNIVSGLIAHSLEWYRFIGRIMGRAMYQGILVDVAFAGFFLAKVNFLSDELSVSSIVLGCQLTTLGLLVARTTKLSR
jgi:hypothetical protein